MALPLELENCSTNLAKVVANSLYLLGKEGVCQGSCVKLVISGRIHVASGTLVSMQVTNTEVLAPDVTTQEELPTTQAESTEQNSERQIANGGEKISGSRTTIEDE